MEIEFINESGAESGTKIKFDRAEISIGRDPECDWVFDNSRWPAVSRRHARLSQSPSGWLIEDAGSSRGTFVNDARLGGAAVLNTGDCIQFGKDGPVLRVHSVGPVVGAARPPAAAGNSPAPARAVSRTSPLADTIVDIQPDEGLATLVARTSTPANPPVATDLAAGKVLLQKNLGAGAPMTIGRAVASDITLDALQISNRHACLRRTGGFVVVEDLGSTNGTHVNGIPVSAPVPVRENDVIQIGPFALRVDAAGVVSVFDTRAETRIDVIKLSTEVRRRGGGALRLLDGIALTIEPNKFVGLLGPSGAGKSTLMDAMNGMRPATEGNVLINGLDLYQHLDLLKQGIGYVPQDDIIHRELTVARTLHYVAKLRLAEDVSDSEIERLVREVMSLTGLSERAEVRVSQLSGGQRKRVSIAVELITKPAVIYLDEPTSGLDPGTEDKIMRLFREIAESGRTVILTTHAMENVRLFDKIVVLMRGRLVFYGGPQEALAHVGATSFQNLYDQLEAPIAARLAGKLHDRTAEEQQRLREQAADEVADEWKLKFLQTPQYRDQVATPPNGMRPGVSAAGVGRGTGARGPGALRQFGTLTRRYVEVLGGDRLNLAVLLGQAPLIGVLTWFVTSGSAPRDFPYFILAVVAMWFGTSVAAREIIRERAIFTRERMVGMGLLPYLGSKLLLLGVLVGVQSLLLFGTLKLLDGVGLMTLPGLFHGLPQLGIVLLTAMVGIGFGLLVSALVKTSEMATSLVPLILIPQILFAGLVGVPEGASRIVGLAMPTTWAYDGIKRYSGLDTLETEGSDFFGKNRGRGLYQRIEQANESSVKRAKDDLARYRKDAERQMESYKEQMEDYLKGGMRGAKPEAPRLAAAPVIADAQKVPKKLDAYVSFLHPWMNRGLIPAVLVAMVAFLALLTLAVLKSQDIRRKSG